MIKFPVENGEENQGHEEENRLLPKGQMSHNRPTPDFSVSVRFLLFLLL